MSTVPENSNPVEPEDGAQERGGCVQTRPGLVFNGGNQLRLVSDLQ